MLTPAVLRAQATAPAVALGSVNVGSSGTGTVTFTFSASTTVGLISVVTQGATGLDFSLNSAAPGSCTATTYASMSTCTVGVQFAPTAAGARYGAVNLLDGSGNILSSGVVSGIGLAPLPVFPAGTASVITSSITLPNFLSIDGAGNVYQPSQAAKIYKITSGGVVSTFYSASFAFTGTAVDPAGNVYVGYTGQILKLNNDGALVATWPVSGTVPAQPQGMAFDSKGNLYVADSSGGQIVVISPAGVGSVLSVGSLSTPGFTPYAVAVDSANTVYIPDYANSRIIKVTSTGATSVLNITGTAIASPNGIAVDAAGNIYLAEGGSAILLHITPGGVATNVTPTLSPAISYPVGVVLDGHGLLYLSDQNSSSVDKINLLSASSSVTGTTAVGSASAQQTATVENDGNATATFTSIAAVAPGVKGSSTTCSTSTPLASDATCVAAIDFAPTTHGSPQTGTLSLNGSNFAAPVQTITGYVAGDPVTMSFSTAPPSSVTAGGNAGSVVVAFTDNSGNAATSASGTATLAVTASGYTTQTYTATPSNTTGMATFNTSGSALTLAGAYTYTVTYTGVTTIAASETVVGAAAFSLSVTPASTSGYVGVSDSMTVNAYDSYGNIASSSDTIRLSSTDSTATLPANFALSNGTATKPVSFGTAGSQTVTATDTANASLTKTSVAITVLTAPSYVITSSAGDTSGACTNQNAPGATPDSKCTVYAAFAAVTALGNSSLTSYVPIITFAPALTASGPLTITMSQTITGSGNFLLTGPGAVTNSVTLSGGNSVGFLSWGSGAGTVSGLTFTGFKASEGAVLTGTSSSGTLSASNDIFTGNTATGSGGGGAIYVGNSSNLSLTSDTFTSNTAASNGGAVAVVNSTLNASRCTFVLNNATSTGGAVYLSGTTNATITGSAFGGQGANGTTGGNTATNAGGAIYAILSSTSYSLKVYDSLFSGNTAGTSAANGSGGAISTSNGTNYFYDDTFTANSVTGSSSGVGGALYQTLSTDYFYNLTVSGNTAKYRGGGVDKNSGSLYAYDSIIEGNTSTAGSYPDVYSNSTLNATTGSVASTSSTATTNPLLSALGNYGGSTLTMVPLPGSPALRAGNTSTTYTGSQTLDQRGYPRTINSTIDAGAVQSNYTLSFVTQPVNTSINTALLPPPTVQVFESGVAFGGAGGTLNLAASAGLIATTAATTVSGLVSVAPTFTTPEAGDALTVSVTNGSTTTVASETSGLFNITDPTAKSIGYTAAPPPQLGTGGNAGTVQVALYNASGVIDTTATNTVTLAVTGTASASYGPMAAVAGVATFNLSGTALAAGSYTYTASSGYTTDTVVAVEAVSGANAWVLNANQTLVKLSSTGTLTTTVTGAGSTSATYGAIAFDQAGDLYSVNSAANSLQYTTNSGGTQANYTGGGLNAPVSLAVDGAGYVWIANSGNNTVSEFTDARSAVSGTTGYGSSYASGDTLSTPSSIAIDQTGGVWVTNKGGNTITHIFGAARPVMTPLSAATATGTLGTKP